MSDPVALNNSNPSGTKRKRSPSTATAPSAAPLSKSTKTTANGTQLQINYLARQCADDLPFITKDDTLPNLLDILTSYSHVLDRQESLASNLGARPLGPILIKRFERCFDAPPKIIASHSHAKGASNAEDEGLPQVTWLDVVHFAQAHPAQFSLATFSEGRRVCQFYYPQKQVRVQVSEEDFLFISSGRCQDLIPPLPIWEDEEKEVGTCEILEKALRELTNAADMVAARTRQLGHRLKGRRMAIQERRTEHGHAEADRGRQSHSPPSHHAPPTFVATNSQLPTPVAGRPNAGVGKPDSGAAVRTDLLKHFQSLPHNQPVIRPEARRLSLIHPHSPAQAPPQHHTPQPAQPTHQAQPAVHTAQPEMGQPSSSSASPAPTGPPNGHPFDPLSYYVESNSTAFRPSFTPTNAANSDGTPKHNFSRPLPPSQESSQPYRALCQAHMESLPRGSRVLPPCDRCRRLRMDCLKNLSSCAGCTKKHARCHWKDVRREEVQGLDGFEEAELLEAHAESYQGGNTFADPDMSRRASEDGSMRRLPSEEPLDSTIVAPSMGIHSLGRVDVEQHSQPLNNPTQPEPMSSTQHNAANHGYQHNQHHDNEVRASPSSFLAQNHSGRHNEVDDNHHAMDLLRLLSRDATHAASGSPVSGTGQGAGAAPGARNHGAFRSVYSPHGADPGPSDGSATASTNSSAGLGIGVGIAGGDRL